MGCGGDREKLGVPTAEQKWDYINLNDFRTKSCITTTSYGILYISLIISVTCYAVDIFTAVNLIIFDRWSGQVKPIVPFTISRWIFAGCIMLSWLLLAYRWMKAIRAMRNGGVAQSYLDPLAVRIQSIRPGSGQGFRRFLVFAELTKSKKGSEYVALFTYFSFEAWLRIIFAEGPRNAINAMTLYSVMQLNLIPEGDHSGDHPAVIQFFLNLQALSQKNPEQAAIYFGMLFTLIIWVFAALSFISAVVFYVVFLWHHIPSSDGGLTGFCKRKIDSRLQKIVAVKVTKALQIDTWTTKKKDVWKGPEVQELKRQPTVPNLETASGDKLPHMPMLDRNDTTTTLPLYTSRAGSPNEEPMPPLYRQPTLPEVSPMSDRPMFPSRSATQSSAVSKMSSRSNASLMGDAQPMGFGDPGRHEPSRMGSERSLSSNRPPVNRSMTGASQYSQRSNGPPGRNGPMMPPPSRQNTNMSNKSYNSGYQNSLQGPDHRMPGPPSRQNTNMSNMSNASYNNDNFRPAPPNRQGTNASGYFSQRPASPAFSPMNGAGQQRSSSRQEQQQQQQTRPIGPPIRQNTAPQLSHAQMSRGPTPTLPPINTSQHRTPGPQYAPYNATPTSAPMPPPSQTLNRSNTAPILPDFDFRIPSPASSAYSSNTGNRQQQKQPPQSQYQPHQFPPQHPAASATHFQAFNPSQTQVAAPFTTSSPEPISPPPFATRGPSSSSSSPTLRNFSAPLRSPKNAVAPPVLQRVGTAPLMQSQPQSQHQHQQSHYEYRGANGNSGYDESILDAY
ncbi:hypothetical protein MMC25_003364 [Agyrium rufum]|nr:hypothetical protein [Agyrium rufum]